jgi:DNA-directed RNA polymerase specialized sigma24 family protein
VRIVTAIRALGPSRRVVAALYFCEGLSCGEIADLLRCPRPAVRRRVAAVRTAFSGLEGAHRDSRAREAGKLGTHLSAPEAGPAGSGEDAFRAIT